LPSKNPAQPKGSKTGRKAEPAPRKNSKPAIVKKQLKLEETTATVKDRPVKKKVGKPREPSVEGKDSSPTVTDTKLPARLGKSSQITTVRDNAAGISVRAVEGSSNWIYFKSIGLAPSPTTDDETNLHHRGAMLRRVFTARVVARMYDSHKGLNIDRLHYCSLYSSPRDAGIVNSLC
jgi:hypothetical protein